MSKDSIQPLLQPLQRDVVTVRKLIEQPQDAVHIDSFCLGEFAQAPVASKKCPLTGLRDCESERIRRR
jgi:hypothetical protein